MSFLKEHLAVTEDKRDRNWDERFFKLLSESNLKILTEDPQQGPDGWPYLIAETLHDDAGTEASKVDSAQKIFHWLSTKGIGLVVNPKSLPYPDYVFSFGMIWSFRETGFFMQYPETSDSKQLVVDENTRIKTGMPSKEYLPDYVKNIVKDFFRDQSVFEPKVLMISVDGENYDLCFSVESLGNPTQAEHEGILEAVSWFFPPHYTLALVSEKNLPAFQAL